MMDDGIARVTVVGTGQMGPGIAVVTTLGGCPTTAVGLTAADLAAGRASFDKALAFMVENEVVSAAEAEAAAARLSMTTDIATAGGAGIVIEAITEHLPTKQEFFRKLDGLFPPDVILASNTSGLRITDIAASMEHPERAVTTHFWMPAHLMPLVEVMQGERTSEDTVQRTRSFLVRCGKRPVVGRKDVQGQIGNRLQHAVIREAIYMVQEGIASAEDVETALKAGPGLRWPVYGPLEHLDAIGLEMALAIQSSIFPSLCSSPDPSPLILDLVESGRLGAAAGQGFHDWSRRSVGDLRRERDLWLAQRLKEERRKVE